MTTAERAKLVAGYLFTNGDGDKATRLVMLGPDGRDLGGWAFEPVAGAIKRQIDRASQILQDRIEDLQQERDDAIRQRDEARFIADKKHELIEKLQAAGTELHEEIRGLEAREAQLREIVALANRHLEIERATKDQFFADRNRLRAALEAYPEWAPEWEHDLDGKPYQTGEVVCPICSGRGHTDGRKRQPPTHKPDCLRVLAFAPAGEEKKTVLLASNTESDWPKEWKR